MLNLLDSLDLFPGRDANKGADAWPSLVPCQSGLTVSFQVENVSNEVMNRSKEENDEGREG